MTEYEPDAGDDLDTEYDVQFLDEGELAPLAAAHSPAALFTPSHLMFDANRQLTSWFFRPEDDCSDIERLCVPGLTFEDFLEKAVRLGIVDTEGNEVRDFVDRRLRRFSQPGNAYHVRLHGNRWIRVSDQHLDDGTTVCVVSNISDGERRERGLALLLSDHSLGQPVFERSARALAMGLGFHTATIARLCGDGTAEIVACVHGGHMAPTQKFLIKGTPCEPVYKAGYFTFTGDFFRRFPRLDMDDYFAEIGHGTYVGQVIHDRSGKAVGHLLALDETQRVLDEGDRRLIRLVAEHVGYEFERLDAGVTLKANEDRFRDFSETSSDLFFETDARLRCTMVSEKVETLTGLTRAEWSGRDMTQLGSPHDPAWEACLKDIAERQSFRDVALNLAAPLGNLRTVSLSGKAVFDGSGRFVGYRLAARDVLPNAVAEGRAREAELRVRQLLSTSLEGFALYDDDHRLVLCNDKFRALMFPGLEDKVQTGMTVGQLALLWMKQVPAADRRKLLNFHLDPDALAGDYLDISAHESKTLRVIRRRSEDGGVATLYLDITDLKHREQELSEAKEIAEKASSTKSRFLANVSHELRTPLNAIIGFSEIMKEQILGPIENPRYREYVGDIRTSALHLLDMINDILDISKAEAGQLEISPELVDVSELVNSVVRLMRDQAQGQQIHLVALIHIGIPPFKGDKRRMKQVLINLVSNAIKFTPAGGTVEITAQYENEALKIQVNDTGIGIAADQIEKVLLPFGQVVSDLSRDQIGTGLGLPLAKHLVELHGGELRLESEPGRGTSVCAMFPMEEPDEGQAA